MPADSFCGNTGAGTPKATDPTRVFTPHPVHAHFPTREFYVAADGEEKLLLEKPAERAHSAAAASAPNPPSVAASGSRAGGEIAAVQTKS